MPLAAPPNAQRLIAELFSHLKAIDVSMTRLVELNQSPRENLFAAGSIGFGGIVGVTPPTCTMAPPIGYGPGVILAANPHRRGLTIQNLSAAGGPNITLGLGNQSPQVGQGYTITPGSTWNGHISGLTWTGYVTIVASAAGAIFSGVEILGRNETRRRAGSNLPL